jgi:phage baseplate assembly protein W
MPAKKVRGGDLRGPAYPLTSGREGPWPRRNSKALRRTSIINILSTLKGERVGEPEFGSNLYKLLWSPLDDILVQEIRRETVEAIQRWDPYVQIVGVYPEIQDNTVKLYIDYVDLSALDNELRRVTFSMGR